MNTRLLASVLGAALLLPGISSRGIVLRQGPGVLTQDPQMSMLLAQPKIYIAEEPKALAAFDPPLIRPGDVCFYRITFDAMEQTIELPFQVKPPPGLTMEKGAQGQVLQMNGPVMEPFTTYNFRVRAPQAGEFTIPAFSVNAYGKVVQVPAATLQVVAAPIQQITPAQQLQVTLPSTNVFIGQQVAVRVSLPSVGGPQSLTQMQLTGEGFVVDQGSGRSRFEISSSNGVNVAIFTHELLITPISAGPLKLFAQAFAIANRFGNAFAPGQPGQEIVVPFLYQLLESDPAQISVRPLPEKGRLPGFTGAFGKLMIEPPLLSTNHVRAGEPLKLSFTLRGATNQPFGRVVPPPPPATTNWQTFPAAEDPTPLSVVQEQRSMHFVYTLIPNHGRVTSTPAIPFSAFDPAEEKYIDLTIPAVPITVESSPEIESAALVAPAPSSEGGKELALSPLMASMGRSAGSFVPLQKQPWFLWAQLVPALGFGFLWVYVRRREYLAVHPEIVMRRRARREVRRERRLLRQAARAGDLKRFAAAGVNALRAACAPFYPAESRALVGTDVLAVMDASRPGSSIRSEEAIAIRRFFEATDASRYTASGKEMGDLLTLQPQLEKVLAQLEAKLCV